MVPYVVHGTLQDTVAHLYYGQDAYVTLSELPSESVHVVCTSPPYWGVRDYGHPDQLGLEPELDAYIQSLVRVFQQVRRVLRNDGTCWVNLGSVYAGGGRAGNNPEYMAKHTVFGKQGNTASYGFPLPIPEGLKAKDLIGLPWVFALAMQKDGWWLRAEVIWEKPNPQPEKVSDRPARSHEHVFLFSKNKQYYYNPLREGGHLMRSVWNIPVEHPAGVRTHHAVMPLALPRRVLQLSTSRQVCGVCGAPAQTCCTADSGRATVLDPFSGSATVGVAAFEQGCHYIGCDLQAGYLAEACDRLSVGSAPQAEDTYDFFDDLI